MILNVILHFSDDPEICAFDMFLRQDERDYLDLGFKQQILSIKPLFEKLKKEAFDSIEFMRESWERPYFKGHTNEQRADFVSKMTNFFDFIANPFNKPIFMFQEDVKHYLIPEVEYWGEGIGHIGMIDTWLQWFSFPEEDHLFQSAETAWRALKTTPFIRHISLTD